MPGIPRGFHCGQPAPRWNTAPMAGKAPQPSHEPSFKAPVTLMKQWGWGTDAKATAPQTAAQTLNEELKDPSSVQSFHVPCEPALMGLTAGCR